MNYELRITINYETCQCHSGLEPESRLYFYSMDSRFRGNDRMRCFIILYLFFFVIDTAVNMQYIFIKSGAVEGIMYCQKFFGKYLGFFDEQQEFLGKLLDFFGLYLIQVVVILISAWVLSADSADVLWARTEILFWVSFFSLSLFYVIGTKRKGWRHWFAVGIWFGLIESALILGFIGMTESIIKECAPPFWPASFFYFSFVISSAVYWYFHFVLAYVLIKK